MPEGPSIVILKEEVKPLFEGKKVIEVSGNSKIDKERALNKKLVEFRSWGKHFLICFDDFAFRVHFMLWGSYRVNERKESTPRLSLKFKDGELNFYASSVRIIEGDLDEIYDWPADVMSDEWDPGKAREKLAKHPDMIAADALLEQDIFAGVGNIIKNEVLFRTNVHPLSKMGSLPPAPLEELIKEARNYSFDFYEWKKQYVLKKHWLAHRKNICPRCDIPFKKGKLGKKDRMAYYCTNCQVLYE